MAYEYVPYDGVIVTRREAQAQRAEAYFTGKPCKHGHLSPRETTSARCQSCKVEYQKRYRALNSDHLIARAKIWAENNPEKSREIKRKHYAANRDAMIARSSKHYYDNRAHKLLYVKQWVSENPDKVLATKRKYRTVHADKLKRRVLEIRAEHPERTRAVKSRYRARKRGAEGSFTADDILSIHARQRGRCAYCRVALQKKYHVDHIKPLSAGGSNYPRNLQLTCATCNFRKGPRPAEVFAQRMGLLI